MHGCEIMGITKDPNLERLHKAIWGISQVGYTVHNQANTSQSRLRNIVPQSTTPQEIKQYEVRAAKALKLAVALEKAWNQVKTYNIS